LQKIHFEYQNKVEQIRSYSDDFWIFLLFVWRASKRRHASSENAEGRRRMKKAKWHHEHDTEWSDQRTTKHNINIALYYRTIQKWLWSAVVTSIDPSKRSGINQRRESNEKAAEAHQQDTTYANRIW